MGRICKPEAYKSDPDVALARLAARQHGVVATRELEALGLSRVAIGVRVRNGRLHRVHHGVYAVGHPNVTLEGRFLAAVKACGDRAALSHFSSATLFRLIDPLDRYPDVTAPTRRARHGINTHRASLDAAVVIHRGIPTTTPNRTLEDLARIAPDKLLERVTREAITKRLITSEDLRHPRLREIAPAPTRSPLEDIVLDLILTAGFAKPDVNVPLHIQGQTVIPDFRWPASRLIVEADGAAYHEPISDARRQALLEAHGERVLRVTHEQATRQRPQTVARLRQAGAPLD